MTFRQRVALRKAFDGRVVWHPRIGWHYMEVVQDGFAEWRREGREDVMVLTAAGLRALGEQPHPISV